MLYLPPGVAHEGVAIGESVTISVGFRLPVVQEIAEAWTERQAREAPLTARLADGTHRPTTHAGAAAQLHGRCGDAATAPGPAFAPRIAPHACSRT